MILSQLHGSRIASNYTASCSQQQDFHFSCQIGKQIATRPVDRKAKEFHSALKAVMSSSQASAAIIDEIDSQTGESPVTQAGHVERPPARKCTLERKKLLRQVSDLNGRPFTAAFLAAATGVDVSEVLQSHLLLE